MERTSYDEYQALIQEIGADEAFQAVAGEARELREVVNGTLGALLRIREFAQAAALQRTPNAAEGILDDIADLCTRTLARYGEDTAPAQPQAGARTLRLVMNVHADGAAVMILKDGEPEPVPLMEFIGPEEAEEFARSMRALLRLDHVVVGVLDPEDR